MTAPSLSELRSGPFYQQPEFGCIRLDLCLLQFQPSNKILKLVSGLDQEAQAISPGVNRDGGIKLGLKNRLSILIVSSDVDIDVLYPEKNANP